MSLWRFVIAMIVASLIVAAGLVACGGARGVIVARVGDAQITSRELAQWMARLAPGHFVPDPPDYASCISHEQAHGEQSIGNAIREECKAQYAALRDKALRFAISSRWLIFEARSHRRARSTWRTTARPGGQLGLGTISASPRRLMTERALAARQVEQEIRDEEAPITRQQVSRYYARHISRFERRERRYLDITEDLRSRAAAFKVLKELMSRQGRRVAAFRESYDLPRDNEPVVPGKRPVLKAIFAAKPGVYVGPFRLNGAYAIFRIVRIVPRRVQPLRRVETRIERELAKAEHKRTLAHFLKAWTARWRTVTSCRAAYVVPECRSYTGQQADSAAPTGLS